MSGEETDTAWGPAAKYMNKRRMTPLLSAFTALESEAVEAVVIVDAAAEGMTPPSNSLEWAAATKGAGGWSALLPMWIIPVAGSLKTPSPRPPASLVIIMDDDGGGGVVIVVED